MLRDIYGETVSNMEESDTAGRNPAGPSETVKTDSYCGIYCGACSVLVHGETGRADGFITSCKGIPTESLTCQGCKSDTRYAGCRVCAIRNCAVKKGLAHCVDCSEFPCAQYSDWQKAVRIVPHVGEAAGSAEQIRREGTDAWLSSQKIRWACPACGARFSWYAASCGECGESLGERVYAMKGLRRLVCRFLFPVLYRRGVAGGVAVDDDDTGTPESGGIELDDDANGGGSGECDGGPCNS